MDKKQYNNVIGWTLEHEDAVLTEDSLATARAIFNNMGVALPQGTMQEVYETIKTNDYMGWRACTMQEAQEAANNGSAAIGLSEERIVVLAAQDEEDAVAEAAAVMTLSENTSAYAVSGLEYYAYSAATTNASHRLTSNQVVKQANTDISYPTDTNMSIYTNPVFTDHAFISTMCAKSSADSDFTIKKSGCAICAVASFLIYKSGIRNPSNSIIYRAVKNTMKQATNNAALLNSSGSVSASLNGISVAASFTHIDKDVNKAREALRNGKMCLICMVNPSNWTHFVLADGYDDSKSNVMDWFLVSDPGNGKQYTLGEAVDARYGHSRSTETFTYRIIE